MVILKITHMIRGVFAMTVKLIKSFPFATKLPHKIQQIFGVSKTRRKQDCTYIKSNEAYKSQDESGEFSLTCILCDSQIDHRMEFFMMLSEKKSYKKISNS